LDQVNGIVKGHTTLLKNSLQKKVNLINKMVGTDFLCSPYINKEDISMKTSNRRNRMLMLFVIVVIGFFLINMWAYRGVNSAQGTETQKIEHIAPGDAYELIQEHRDDENFVILDVRTPAEFAQGYIENAINIDFYSKTFRDNLNKLDKEKTYLLYCRSGNRSGRTLKLMEELQFKTAYNMTGGILQWVAERRSVTKQ
jgi:rhodanese-related sulfurtransferase